MSVTTKIPDNPNGSRVRYPVKRFSAPFALGAYDFFQPGNTDQLVMKLSSSSIYLLERINFFGNVAESDWLEGMGAESTFPNFVFRLKYSPAASLFPEPVRCVNYIDNGEQVVYFWTSRKDDELLLSFNGAVTQVPGMVGVDPLLAELNFTIYEITDQPWIKKFIEAKGI